MCFAMTVTVPSGATRTKALGASVPSVSAKARLLPPSLHQINRPTPAAALASRNRRRVRSSAGRDAAVQRPTAGPYRLGGVLDGGADAHVRGAAADVAGHRGIDVVVGRVRK